MEKFIPYEKLSKKKRRELTIARRGSWGALNPVTRKPENPKAYNRKKARKWSDESPMTVPFDLYYLFRTSRWNEETIHEPAHIFRKQAGMLQLLADNI